MGKLRVSFIYPYIHPVCYGRLLFWSFFSHGIVVGYVG